MRGQKLWVVFFAVSCWFCISAFGAVQYKADEKRDPFFEKKEEAVPVAASEKKAADAVVLQGLLWSEQRRRAMVNGRLVKEGDFVGEIKIVEIDKKGVHITRGDKVGYLTKTGIEWA